MEGGLMAVAWPPGVADLPPNPGGVLGDVDRETRQRRLREFGNEFVETTKDYVDAVFAAYAPWNRWREGTALALDPVTRRVQVHLDPLGDVPAWDGWVGYGRPTWTAARIVNKRVKVMLDTHPEHRDAWIDVVTSPP
jgi:hypothetical protein